MLCKVIKAVIIGKINYLIERHGLLLSNHYRVLKQKYTINTIFIIREKIY